jgi:hypothetical protein
MGRQPPPTRGAQRRQLSTIVYPKAAGRLPFRVSDAVRRRKVGGARTRGALAVAYGDWDFERFWAVTGAADMRTDLGADRLLCGYRWGRVKADRPILAGGRPLLRGRDAAGRAPRSNVAAEGVDDMPCRITALSSRMGR